MTTRKKQRTPIIKPRTQGGTFYTFGSAMEDIGLNINELRNKVAISHYAVLDLPGFNTQFNTLSKSDFPSGLNTGDYRFAEGFENYVLNMETVLRNQSSYNFAEAKTVSERVFWKWLQKSCMDLQPDASNANYYLDKNQTVKGFGQITTGAQRADAYGMYNETFVQIPSSYGQMKALFKKVNDNNYYARTEGYYASDSSGYLENISLDEIVDDKLFTGISAKAIYDSPKPTTGPGSYKIDEKDTVCLELDLEKLREYYGNQTLTYDDIAIDAGYDFYKVNSYKFNAILLYYSIYDSESKNILSTNAYGILLLDSAQSDPLKAGDYIFPELVKTKSSVTAAGTSYAFRINIKTTSVYSGDITVIDNSTEAYSMSTDFNDIVRNLGAAIDIMKSNANFLRRVASDNEEIKEFAASTVNKVADIEADLKIMKSGKFKTLDSSVLFTDVLSAKTIISDSSFYFDGSAVGYIKDNELMYDTGKFNNLSVDGSANLQNLINDKTITPSGAYIIEDKTGEIYSKTTDAGIFSSNDLYYRNIPPLSTASTIEPSVVKELVENSNIKFDSCVGVFSLTLPATASSEQGRAILKSLSVTDTVSGNTYIDINNMLTLFSEYMKSYEETHQSLYETNPKDLQTGEEWKIRNTLATTKIVTQLCDSNGNVIYANTKITPEYIYVSVNNIPETVLPAHTLCFTACC